MNYYIEGNTAKAEQIRAAFKELGYDISWSEGCANPDVINIGVERNGAKYVVAETSEYIKDIIKTHPDYKQLELPIESKFKVGDWVVRKDGETFYGGNYAEQITLVEVDEKGKCIWLASTSWVNDDVIRLWTIADAKDGDILMSDKGNPFIFCEDRIHAGYHNIIAYCGINTMGDFCESSRKECWTYGTSLKPTTKEQRDLLFAKMLEAGYEWDEKKKELRKIFEPQFKVGDDIKQGSTIETIAEIDYTTRSYLCESGRAIWFENQDLWHLAPKKHYDIANFKPFDKVLGRNTCRSGVWRADLFSHIHKNGKLFVGIGYTWEQCIPFNDDTKHLLGTTDMCPEEYINW